MRKYCRLATSFTAHYAAPVSGAVDSFYLDGRSPGKHEHERAEFAIDRTDRGFFFAIHASSRHESDSEIDDPRYLRSLNRIRENIKSDTNDTIEEKIDLLAECAAAFTDGTSSDSEVERLPYFAGLLVRDAEIASVTHGDAAAYLYRNRVLYPLTKSDFPLEAINAQGHFIHDFHRYSAGSATKLRYSNIAQLRSEDCIIMCNLDVMKALGQRELLQILADPEKAGDAAAFVHERCAALLPDTSYQFFISYVKGSADVKDSADEKVSSVEEEKRPLDTSGKRELPSDPTGAARAGATLIPPPAQVQFALDDAVIKETEAVIKEVDAVTEEAKTAEDDTGAYVSISPQAFTIPLAYSDQAYGEPPPREKRSITNVVVVILFFILGILGFVIVNYFMGWVDQLPTRESALVTYKSPDETQDDPTVPTGELSTSTTVPTSAPSESSLLETTTQATLLISTTAPRPTYPDTYEIQLGDLLSDIVRTVYRDYDLQDSDIMPLVHQLIEANPDKIDGDVYRAGDILVIPEPRLASATE